MLGMFAAILLAFAPGPFAGMPQAQGVSPQTPSIPQTTEMTIAAEPLTGSDGAIYVDRRCALLPDPASTGKKKPRLDPVICHLETINHSSHREETQVGNELERRNVDIEEQEYVLQNVTTKQIVFVVEQPVAKGWTVDSDPQPTEMQGTTAIFRVYAQPGEIVRLHVGVRRTKTLSPQPVP